jgi:hydroxyethylthiazole kinase-like uncharacterized protein yjeF
MVRPVDGPVELTEFLADRRRNAVAIGPGGGIGSTMREQVRAVLASGAATVLDADALTSFADIHGADTLTSVADDEAALAEAIRAHSGRSVVLTPHDGEYHRLFSKLWPHPSAFSKLEKARLAAGHSGAVVVLKGADSVVAAPDGRATIAANAPPTLATAGAGDVLTGMITGLLAQGMAAFEAASAAVWLHGEAAHAFGPGLIAEDLPDLLPGVYRRLAALIGGPIERPIAE